MRLRLDKFLANKALGSRKEVHALIKQGLVTVDGVVAKKKDMPIDIPEQTIAVNGEIIDSRQIYYVKFNNRPVMYVPWRMLVIPRLWIFCRPSFALWA